MLPNSSGKTPRVLACVLCQHRKIKCDRTIPCSNCVKANVTCTPSTPAPARKRRRPNQDLQQRLARCEELLQEYATAKPPSETSELPTVDDKYKGTGKLIVDDGAVRFMDSFLWANVHDELRAMRDIIDDDDKDDESYSASGDGQTPDQNAGLLFSDASTDSLDDLHPDPAQVFPLWQIFLDRVNPLTKVIHVPTMQPMLVEAAVNRAALPRNVEALMFSIYAMAAVAMTEQESISLLGYTQEAAYKRFSKGVRIALMRIGILNKYDIILLQALVLYLISLTGRYDRHAAWILNGVVVRIAQKMGLHRDGTTLGLSAFETEIRRRIWWQILLVDCTSAMMSGLSHSLLPTRWDTKKPTNINDSDLFLTMTSVEEREGPTDMVYCIFSYEIVQLLLEEGGLESVIMQNEMGSVDAPTPSDVEEAQKRVETLDRTLSEVLRKYADLSMGPVHELAMEIHPMMIQKMEELTCPPRQQPEWGTEIFTPKDNLFKIAVSSGEHNLQLYELAEKRGTFMWYVKTRFQVEVFLFVVGHLSTRTSGNLVERAWVVTERFYHYHAELFDLSVKPHAALAVFVLRGWRKREEMYQTTKGHLPVKPYYIAHLNGLLGSDAGSKGETPVETPELRTTVGDKGQAGGLDMPWDQILGFGEAQPVDWDMFGNTTTAQTPIYPGFGTGSINGWM